MDSGREEDELDELRVYRRIAVEGVMPEDDRGEAIITGVTTMQFIKPCSSALIVACKSDSAGPPMVPSAVDGRGVGSSKSFAGISGSFRLTRSRSAGRANQRRAEWALSRSWRGLRRRSPTRLLFVVKAVATRGRTATRGRVVLALVASAWSRLSRASADVLKACDDGLLFKF